MPSNEGLAVPGAGQGMGSGIDDFTADDWVTLQRDPLRFPI